MVRLRISNNTCFRSKKDKSPNRVEVDGVKAYLPICFNLAQMRLTCKGQTKFHWKPILYLQRNDYRLGVHEDIIQSVITWSSCIHRETRALRRAMRRRRRIRIRQKSWWKDLVVLAWAVCKWISKTWWHGAKVIIAIYCHRMDCWYKWASCVAT